MFSFILLYKTCSLIKMLYWMCESCDCPLTGRQFEHAIKRNFGGCSYIDAYAIFCKHLGIIANAKMESIEVSGLYCILLSCDFLLN